MAHWGLQAVDAYGFDRSNVSTAFALVDQYIATLLSQDKVTDETITRERYQLISMTALYTAIKLSEPMRKLSPDALVDMSRGCFQRDQFEETEAQMLQALNWKLNPPTAPAYVDLLVDLVGPKTTTPEVRDLIWTTARQTIGNTVTDSSLAPIRPSLVAIASILLAILETKPQQLGNSAAIRPCHIADDFVLRVEDLLGIYILDDDDNEDATDLAIVMKQMRSALKSSGSQTL